MRQGPLPAVGCGWVWLTAAAAVGAGAARATVGKDFDSVCGQSEGRKRKLTVSMRPSVASFGLRSTSSSELLDSSDPE